MKVNIIVYRTHLLKYKYRFSRLSSFVVAQKKYSVGLLSSIWQYDRQNICPN